MTRLEHKENYNTGYDIGYRQGYNGEREDWDREEFSLPLWRKGYSEGYKYGKEKYERFVRDLRIDKQLEKDRNEQ